MEDSQIEGHYDTGDNSIMELIYEDAGNNCKFLRDDINALNTRLGILLGFNAAFVRLSMDLPDQYSCLKLSVDGGHCYSCQWLKILTFVFVIASIIVTLKGIYPLDVASILYPNDQTELLSKVKADIKMTYEDNLKQELVEYSFRQSVINHRDATIRSFLAVSDRKAEKLESALKALGVATVLAALNILVDLLFC